MRKYYHFWLPLLAIVLIIAGRNLFISSTRIDLPDWGNRLEKEIHLAETQAHKLLNDRVLFEKIRSRDFTVDDLNKWQQLPLTLLLYENDSLLFWSDNDVLPIQHVTQLSEKEWVLKLKNGYYEWVLQPYQIEGHHYFFTALVPLYYQYGVENRYLKSHFPYNIGKQERVGFSQELVPEAVAVMGAEDHELFYIYSIDNSSRKVPPLGLILEALAMGLLLIWFYTLARSAARKTTPFVAWILLSIALFVLRALLLNFGVPIDFISDGLFNPVHYATGSFTPSLGDLILHLLCAVTSIIFLYRHVKIIPHTASLTGLGIFLFIQMLLSTTAVGLIRSLIIDSSISFDVTNVLTLDYYSAIGLGCLSLFFVGWFLVGQKMIRLLVHKTFSLREIIPGIGIAVLLYSLLVLLAGWWELYWLTILSGCLISGFFVVIYKRNIKALSFTSILIWLAIFSAITAMLFHKYNLEKERNQRKLATLQLMQQKDPVAEFLFNEIKGTLENDNMLRAYFLNPVISRRSLIDRLNTLYFRDFRSYNIEYNAYSADSTPYLQVPETYLGEIKEKIERYGGLSSVPGLRYIAYPSGNYEYAAFIDVRENDSLIGFVNINFRPKTLSYSNVYPELLLEESVRTSGIPQQYSYAMYADGALIKQRGDFPYDRTLDKHLLPRILAEGSFQSVQWNGFHHLVYQGRDELVIVVSLKKPDMLQPVSLFSFIFCFYFLFIILLTLLYMAYLALFKHRLRPNFNRLSFRNKVQLVVISVIIVSFVIIGLLTIYNINSQYDQYHRERLMRKVQQVMSGVDYMEGIDFTLLSDTASVLNDRNLLNLLISNLADIHSMDINLYSLHGDLLVSSQPEIFDKGLLSVKIDPVAFYEMRVEERSQYMQNEHIGSLEYISAYVPMNIGTEKVNAILNLPYYAKEANLQNEISGFLVYFINVYVLLLVIAGIIALILSNSITGSLKLIGEKMKQTQLGKPNTPLTWNNRDEIGQLVGEYNKMIEELEKSAELLAKSERESAWREMAKQVAHEIKNPLTPMKLSIQHLQRASAENRPDIQERVEQVSKTLIEQIDNLSRIANEFSAFAKMPVSQKERTDLTALLQNVARLYENAEVQFTASIPGEPVYIMADKGQLLRVFNNLVKNAIQAIPDDRIGLITLSVTVRPNHVRISIRDNGIGIPEGRREQVFAPNFTTKGSGMGLGLAMSRNIIESHHGVIDFDSEEGEGTEFFVILPLDIPPSL